MLGGFLRALRETGVEITPAEAIEAHCATARFGIGDRDLLRDVLGAVLAKTVDERERFDACFDRYFLLPPAMSATEDAAGIEAWDLAQLPDLARLLLSGDQSALALEIGKAAAQAESSGIAHLTQKAALAHRILVGMGIDEVDDAVRKGRGSGDPPQRTLAERLAERRRELLTVAQRHVERDYELYASGRAAQQRDQRLFNISLAAIKPRDIAAVQDLCRRMAMRLVKRYRNQRSVAHKGKLDVRRTLRQSLATRGIPFRIAWKHEVVKRMRLVVVCDVSKSVAPYAALLLLFLHKLHEVFEHINSFAFSDRLFAVGDLLAQPDAETVITDVIRRCGMGATDYGRSLRDLAEGHNRLIGRRTVLVVLGDARNNHGDPALEALRQIKRSCRSLVWLNPEPETTWGTGDSVMSDYSVHCDLVRTCGNLRQLERAVLDILVEFPIR